MPTRVPFFAPTSYGPVTNASSTDFYIVEPAGSTTGEFETFMQVISPWEREFLLLNV